MNTTTPTTQPLPKIALTAKEAAAFLSVSLPTLHRITKAGEVPHFRVGRALRYRVEDLERFMAERVTTVWEDTKPGAGRPKGAGAGRPKKRATLPPGK